MSPARTSSVPQSVLLVVEDRTSMMAGVVADALPEGRRVATACTVVEALARVRGEDIGAALIETRLADGSGFEIAALLRSLHGFVPLLFTTDDARGEEINAAQGLRGGIIARPFPSTHIKEFVQRYVASEAELRSRTPKDAALDALAWRCGLNEAEVALARVAILGLEDRLPTGTSGDVHESVKRRLLAKVGVADVAGLAECVFRESLVLL
jgi:DNA-binding response OmpR family regulator